MSEQLESLVKRAIDHNEEAFWRIYELKWKDVFYTALKILEDEQEAADAAQEAFLRAYNAIGSLKEPRAFDAWLYRIVVNVCNGFLTRIINEKRWRDIDPSIDTLEEERTALSPNASLEGKADQEDLLAAIDALPVSQRTAVVLHYFDQMTYAQIAEATGVTRLGVETRLRRARRSIKAYLKQLEKKSNVVSAMLAAPFFSKTLATQAQLIATSSIDTTLRAGIEGGIAALRAGGTIAGVAGGAIVSGGVTAGGAAAGGASLGVGAKVAIGITSAALVAGAGMGMYAQLHKTPQPLQETRSVSEKIPEPSKPSTVSVEATTAVTPEQPAPQAVSETPAQPVAAPEQSVSQPPSPQQPTPAPINTLAEMIGASNEQELIGYTAAPNRMGARALFSRVGLAGYSQQISGDVTYRLYVLDKQDKRLIVIEKDATDYGISYKFGAKATTLIPQPWDLMFEYR